MMDGFMNQKRNPVSISISNRAASILTEQLLAAMGEIINDWSHPDKKACTPEDLELIEELARAARELMKLDRF